MLLLVGCDGFVLSLILMHVAKNQLVLESVVVKSVVPVHFLWCQQVEALQSCFRLLAIYYGFCMS